ncbi:MAG: hydrolase [Rhodospirillaceae bacterium]|nr:MAG: hydrolase [Rhodospirillaceae bacterium]
MLLTKDKSCLLVIDIQSRLNPVMFDESRAPWGAAKLLQGADILGVPALLCEQYPKGIGATVDELQDLMPKDCPIEKNTFSCASDPVFQDRFKALNKTQAVICGIETHVCVLQSALELLADGIDVFVVEDATASRTLENHVAALNRIRAEGGRIVTLEMVLFEWLKKAGTPEFKQISQLIK